RCMTASSRALISSAISIQSVASPSMSGAFSATTRSWTPSALPVRGERFAAGGDGFCGHERESDDARLLAVVHPVMNGAALHQHVAGLQVHAADVELHVDLAGNDHRIVDRIGAVIARRDAGAEADDAKHGAVVDGSSDLLVGGIVVAVVVDGEAFARPDHAVERAGP